MSFDLSNDNILKYLNKHDLDPTFQKENDQTYILMKIKEVEVPVFLGARKESGLLQVMAYLPYELPAQKSGDIARMLHHLNRQLDMPGFGMDEKAKLLFYRCVIPCPDDQVNENLLGMYLGTLRVACDTFMYAISSVASGTKKMDDLLKDG